MSRGFSQIMVTSWAAAVRRPLLLAALTIHGHDFGGGGNIALVEFC